MCPRDHRSVLASSFDLPAYNPHDEIDALGSSTFVYRLEPRLLAAFGVRFVVYDGAIHDEEYTERAVQTGRDGSKLWLYELAAPNLGQYSPTQTLVAQDYRGVVRRRCPL